MIRSFRCKDTEKLYHHEQLHRFRSIERTALRKLCWLSSAETIGDLRSPPGNHLEALKGVRKGQHSIRINEQWRICFVWKNGDAYEVEIVDYH